MKIYGIAFLIFTISQFGQAADYIVIPSTWDDYDFSSIQPGDNIILADGHYSAGKLISINGTSDLPVTIKSQNDHGATIGNFSDDVDTVNDHALLIMDSNHLILEGIRIINWAGIDGTQSYQSSGRDELHEGVSIYRSNNIVIQSCIFDKVATRAVFISGNGGFKKNITIRNNIFLDVGDDTVGAGVAIGDKVIDWQIYNNIFSTNVDGVVTDKAGGGGLIDSNIFLFNPYENSIDIKRHYQDERENINSYINNNVIYGGKNYYASIEVQLSSSNVKIVDNKIYNGHDILGAVNIKGRCSDPCYPVDQNSIVGNLLIGNGEQNGIRVMANSAPPADIPSLEIKGNMVLGYANAITIDDTSTSNHNHSGDTSGWEYLVSGNSYSGSESISPGVIDYTYAEFNQVISSEPSFISYKSATDKEISIYEHVAQTIPIDEIKNAYNKDDLPFPIISQSAQADTFLVVLSSDVGLLTPEAGTSHNWSLTEDLDALSGYGLKTLIAANNVVGDGAEASFRLRFINPDVSIYHLYVRASCGDDISNCGAGDSFYRPSVLDNDLSDSSTLLYKSISNETNDYQWVLVGSYDVDPGKFHRLTIGAREYHFKLDAMVFHEDDNLVSSATTATLDNLVCAAVGCN